MRQIANSNSNAVAVAVAVAMLVVISTLSGSANGQVIDVLDDTILLSNGTPTAGNTSDAEDNFGGRQEFIVGSHANRPRGGLIRFDVSSVAEQINNPTQRVTAARLVLNTADAREGVQPDSKSIFEVYAVVPENAGWLEGTQAGSRAGWSGEPESASLLYLANPEFEPEDAISPDIIDEFDDVRLWHSASLNDGFPVPFEVGLDTDEESIGLASTDEIDGSGFLEINLEPNAVDSLLSQWLADKDENAGLYIYPTEGSGQWFFESVEGFEDEAIDLDLTFGAGGLLGDFDGNGELEFGDLNQLIGQIR